MYSAFKKVFILSAFLFVSAALFSVDLYFSTSQYDKIVNQLKELELEENSNERLRMLSYIPDMEEYVALHKQTAPLLQKNLGKVLAVETVSEDKYPFINLTYRSEGYNRIYIGFAYYESENVYDQKEFRMDVSEKARYGEFLTTFVTSYFSQKKNYKPVKELKDLFHLVDVIPVNSYYGKKRNKNNSLYVKGFKDYSFVVRDDNGFEAFDGNGTFIKSITDQLDEPSKGLYKYSFAIGKNEDDGFTMYHPARNIASIFNKEKDFYDKKSYDYPLDENTEDSEILAAKDGTLYFADYSECPHYYVVKNSGPVTKTMNFHRSYKDCVSPKGNLWLCSDNKYIFIFDNNLKCKRVIFPELPESFFNLSLQLVLEDDSFICRAEVLIDEENKKDVFLKLNSRGQIQWKFFPPKEMNSIEFYDYASGIYYAVSDDDTPEVYRFTTNRKALPEYLQNISAYSESVRTLPASQSYSYYKKIADEYYDNGGLWLAYMNYAKYLEYCSADSETTEKYLQCELMLLKKDTQFNSAKAMQIYDELGEESAKEFYSIAMKNMEKYKKLNPYDKEINQLYADLKNYFSEDENIRISASEISSIQIENVELPVLFPALMNVYTSNPSGYITVKNNGNKPVTDIQVFANVKKYMDYPTEGGKVKTLKPGESTQLEVYTQLNDSALKVSEKTSIQMQFTVSWKENGKTKKTTVVRPVSLYSKSAMTWIDTAMLSCFIMPNNGGVNKFVFDNIKSSKVSSTISNNIYSATCIINALGSIPLKYVPDPVTPLSSIIEDDYVVDTVRFPGDTLKLKGGDCDDMTVLFCSAMEAAGIKTALITTPGHIFAAFDSGMKLDLMWRNLSSKYKIMVYGDQVYIPVEVTTLDKGFVASWETASKEIKKNKNDLEFVVVANAREKYPPVKVDEEGQSVSVNKGLFEKSNVNDFARLRKNILGVSLDKASEKTENPKELNGLAKNYYGLGLKGKAIAALEKALQLDSEYISAYKNLASLYSAEGKTNEAEKYLKRVSELKAEPSVTEAVKAEGRASGKAGFIWEE
ncbi:MAG: tetratricopeptide repeat protein [Treponema sp.]|nr:tetratricopeptide repeat protein [Treponema sp.]